MHNITDNQNHRRALTDDPDNTINKASLTLHNTYLCINYFAIHYLQDTIHIWQFSEHDPLQKTSHDASDEFSKQKDQADV